MAIWKLWQVGVYLLYVLTELPDSVKGGFITEFMLWVAFKSLSMISTVLEGGL